MIVAELAPVQDAALGRVENYLRAEQRRRTLHGANGRVEGVSEWGGGESGYQYDANGDLIAIGEADGRRRRYGYDEQRRLVLVEQGDGRTTHYHYDAQDRLETVQTGTAAAQTTRYRYDGAGRVAAVQCGHADASIYRYDESGRLHLARTAHVSTSWRYDAAGRAVAIEQSLAGVTLRVELQYDGSGRLAAMILPGSAQPLRYTWDAQGRPQAVAVEDETLLRFAYDDAAKMTTITHANGVTAQSTAQPVDGRPLRLQVWRGEQTLLARRITYGEAGEITGDGERAYSYDGLGRLIGVARPQDSAAAPQYLYTYDQMDNLIAAGAPGSGVHYQHDAAGRLQTATDQSGAQTRFVYDRLGRLVHKAAPDAVWAYRYDDAGHLHEVRRDEATVAAFLYDHKGRLVWAESAGEVRRYLYGDADDLLAVTDAEGRPLRVFVRTPLGVHAEIHGALGEGEILFRHSDERGTLRLATDAAGEVCAVYRYDPFGAPCHAANVTYEDCHVANVTYEAPSPPHPADRGSDTPSSFTGRDWCAALGLYYFGARWYDPALGRFLTPDSYTGAPDDVRLVNPLHGGSRQAALRGQILGEWLKQPRVRNAYAFCGNDPIGRVDPNGHWSFGGVVLMLLGAIWALPTTLLGILIEITCLVGEVIRWLVWAFSFGHASWETPGFDAAASGHLNAFALVFTGGWLGSFSGMLGITFGNVFFAYKQWETSPYIAALPDPMFPPAYNGRVALPRQKMLYEHELRHTQQTAWFGPFFHLGMPLFGFYEWDVIVKGYRNAWTERDARSHAEP